MRWVVALAACGLLGCGDDTGGAADAAVRADADPTALQLTGIAPRNVFEGSGCLPDGSGGCEPSHAVVVVLEGANISAGAQLTLTVGDVESTVPVVVSGDGTIAAFEFRSPPDVDLRAGDLQLIPVTITQGDDSVSQTLHLDGLDELIDIDEVAGFSGRLDSATALAPLYSRIRLGADIEFFGSRNVRLAATSEIVLDSAIDASATSMAPGPGGCAGGASGQAAPCAGGGQAGSLGGGGGGGGHAAVGSAGAGGAPAVGGAGGEVVGDATFLPMPGLAADSVHGAGGGGGSPVGVDQDVKAGGAGGAGGGVVEVTSFGRLAIGAQSFVDANGFAGNPGVGESCLVEHSGSGGGGSGGAILLRALTSFVDGGAAANALSVQGGAGGVFDTGCESGGNGADGRLRFDLPSDAASPPIGAGIAPYRGPVIDPATSHIATAAAFEIDILGGDSQIYFVERVGDETSQMIATDGTRRAAVTVMLEPGLNQICVKVSDVVDAVTQPEGLNCRFVALVEP